MSDQVPDKALDVLVKEYQSCAEYIRELESQIEKISSLSLSLIVLVFGIGVKENIHVIFLLIPAAIIAIIFYMINITESIMVLGGYAASLEVRINDRVGEKILRWETQLSPKFGHSNLSAIVLTIVSLIASFGILFYALNQSFYYYSRILFGFQVVLVGLSLIIALWLIIRIRSLHRRVLNICQQPDEKKDGST